MQNSSIAKIDSLTNELRTINENISKKSDKDNVDCLETIKMQKINDEIDKELYKKSFNVDSDNVNRVITSETTSPSNRDTHYYKKAFNEYLRNGTHSPTLCKSAGVFDRNQFNATMSLTTGIIDYLQKYSPIRQIASNIRIRSDSFDAVCYSGNIDTQWSDGSAIAASNNNFIKKTIKTHDLTAQPRITQRTIDDSEIDVESYIADQLAITFLDRETDAFINGSGINQPFGILSTPEVMRMQSNSTLTVDSLLCLYYSLPEKYQHDAYFMMNKATVHSIRTFKDSNNQYLWMPGILSGCADTLMGVPLRTCSAVPIIGDKKDIIIYGNFKMGYQIVDRGDIAIQRDPFSAKPFVIFFATKRVGGDVIDDKAFVVLQVV